MRAPRQITEPELEGLKRASGVAVEAAGGVVAVAEKLGQARSKISEKASPFHLDRAFTVLDVAEIERLAKTPAITRALAQLAGFDLVPVGRFDLENPHLHLARVIAETGEVTALTAKALEDGKISVAEARTLKREAREAITALQAFEAQLTALEGL